MTTPSLVAIPNEKDQFAKEAIEVLQEALEEAQSGQVQAVAITMLRQDGSMMTKGSASRSRQAFLGALFQAALDFANSN